MKSVHLSYNIMLLNQTGDATNVSKYLSFDDAECNTFPSPTMSAALFAGLLLPDDFDEASANGETKCHIKVVAVCDGVCEEVEVCDTVTSTIDAVVALYSALNLAAEKLLPGAGGRLA